LSSKSDRLDTTTWHIARVYDWWLGGKDNFQVDRDQAQAILQVYPGARREARNNRAFMREAVRRMARAGVRQFLDIGAGIPTSPNLYEVAQSFEPKVRVVYVDNDPLVLVHARALMTGATDYIDADIRQPEKILEGARQTLDFTQPVGLTLISILHFLDEQEPYNDKPYEIVARLLEPLVSGSYLAISHGTFDLFSDELREHMRDMAKASRRPFGQRTKTQIARFFDGLEMVPPGLVPLHEWLPEEDPDYPERKPAEPGTEGYYAGLARVR